LREAPIAVGTLATNGRREAMTDGEPTSDDDLHRSTLEICARSMDLSLTRFVQIDAPLKIF
jgi:hypothetical protein